MEIPNRPELIQLDWDQLFETLHINGMVGMLMPPHHSVKETVNAAQEGRALLQMPDTGHILKDGSSFIIPAGVGHNFSILKDFKAIAVMEVDSEINFK